MIDRFIRKIELPELSFLGIKWIWKELRKLKIELNFTEDEKRKIRDEKALKNPVDFFEINSSFDKRNSAKRI